MARSRFKVCGRLDHASRVSDGTVTIDRGAGLFSVRPLRRRTTYTLPLDKVAERAKKAALWLGEDVLRRSVPLPNALRLKR